MSIKFIYRYLLLLLIISYPSSVLAEFGSCDILEVIDCDKDQASKEAVKGKWTLGIGVASVANVPAYIGSDETRNITLPIPYILYNGPKVRVSQSGINGKLFNSENLYVSLSLSGAIPVNSDKNNARKGMDDIDAVIEYGPSFKYFLTGGDRKDNALLLDISFREARTIKNESLNFSSTSGIVFRKKFENDYLRGRLNFSSTLKFEFVSDKYAQAFYGVDPIFETASRERYKAEGGYAGFRFNTNFRWKKDNHMISVFFAHSDISDAKYVSSPLIKVTTHSLFGGSYFYLFD